MNLIGLFQNIQFPGAPAYIPGALKKGLRKSSVSWCCILMWQTALRMLLLGSSLQFYLQGKSSRYLWQEPRKEKPLRFHPCSYAHRLSTTLPMKLLFLWEFLWHISHRLGTRRQGQCDRDAELSVASTQKQSKEIWAENSEQEAHCASKTYFASAAGTTSGKNLIL